MFCKNCGKQIPDNVAFCTYCGQPVSGVGSTAPQPQQMAQPQPQPQPQQPQQMMQPQQPQQMMQPVKQPKPQKAPGQSSGSKKTILVVGLVSGLVVLLGVGVLLYFLLIHKPTVNLNDYISIECKGYNSYGKAVAVFDEEKYYDDYEDSIKFAGDKADKSSGSAAKYLLDEYVKGSLDKEEKLSNGDEIKYTWDIDEKGIEADLKVNVEYEDITYKVKDLETADTFDIFGGITVEYEGSAPNGYVVIENDNDMYPVSGWTFIADKSDGLSNGDKIIVSVENGDELIADCVDEYGKIPEAMSKEYEVSGLDTYVTVGGEIPSDALASMKSKTEELIASDLDAKKDIVTNYTYNYAGYYLLSAKPDSSAGYDNMITLVYTVNLSISADINSTRYTGSYGYYSCATFYDVYTGQDGSGVVNVDGCSETYSEVELNTYVSNQKYNFWGFESLSAIKEDRINDYLTDYDMDDKVDSTVIPVATTSNTASNNEDDPDKDADVSSIDDHDFVLPDSDITYLKEDDVRRMSQSEIQDAINEIYARHGYIFQTDSIQRKYEQYSWYVPRSTSQQQVKDTFNSVENANLALLERYRN